jgi:glycosyltransferase involved in cell wall biosynthesis
MEKSGLKIDLHVHSKCSTRPSQWILQKLNCPESFTQPLKLREIARARGMDLVTISDHNTISGALEIAHLDDVFISEEVTTYFPEDQCKLHVLALDINESQHEDISRARSSVYDLVAYLNAQKICHILAHPFYDMNHKLTFEHFEKMLLLFTNFEMNGSRDQHQNDILAAILRGLVKDDIDRLADRHHITPVGDRPWEKNITGGSDDHSSLNIARMHTVVPGARTKAEFFAGLQSGRAIVNGRPATPQTMAHNLYGIAWQYYGAKFNLDRYTNKDILFKFMDCALSVNDEERGFFTRLGDFLVARKPSFSFLHAKSDDVTHLIRNKAHAIVMKNANLLRMLKQKDDCRFDKEGNWFDFVNDASEDVMKTYADSILDSLSSARLFNVFQTIGGAGTIYTLLAPYFMSYALFTKDRRFAELCREKYAAAPPADKKGKRRIALFTDTLYETNGVALTLQMQLKMAQKNDKHLSIMTCCPHGGMEGTQNFAPIGTFELPEYPEIRLHYPPFLKMLDYCYKNEFNIIHASTPGPMGMAALAIARIMDLPLHGTYHTALPQYVSELTGDADLEALMWKFMVWYHNQMDIVYVPSQATADELIEKGIVASKIQLYPRGIDIERFHPSRKNGFWKSGYQVPDAEIKVLYVGRVSKEKNLDVLARAIRQVGWLRKNIRFIIVGDGPYLEEMKCELRPTSTLFTGYLTGDGLSRAYASADLFVFPSGTDTFGNVVLEAQASGLPVIVTDKGGPRENLIPGETGLIVSAMDSQAIVDAVINLCEDPARMAAMGSNARKYMESRAFESAFLQSWEMYPIGQDPTPPTADPERGPFLRFAS